MSTHTFKGINFETSGPLSPVTTAELEKAERALGCRFPPDYRDFILRFGPGEFKELTLRLFAPAEIVEMTPDDRNRFSEYWFWTDSPDVWTQEQAMESIACFDGSSGDDIRFHPTDPKTMYLLVHEERVILPFTSFTDLVHHFQRTSESDPDTLTFTP
ncbi:MAG: SMI1/KNR4 family protein [Verrucomicrobiota bacterium]